MVENHIFQRRKFLLLVGIYFLYLKKESLITGFFMFSFRITGTVNILRLYAIRQFILEENVRKRGGLRHRVEHVRQRGRGEDVEEGRRARRRHTRSPFWAALRIRDIYSGSRIRIFSISDPVIRSFSIRIHIKELKYFSPKKLFLSSRKYDPQVVHP
jgi:hypothetical protein